MRGKETHLTCNFVLLLLLSFLSSVQTTWAMNICALFVSLSIFCYLVSSPPAFPTYWNLTHQLLFFPYLFCFLIPSLLFPHLLSIHLLASLPPPFSLQAHAYLSRYYREHNVELSKLLHRLGQPLPSWLREELQKVSSIDLCDTYLTGLYIQVKMSTVTHISKPPENG